MMLAADNWCVKVEDRVYGPYSSQQLRKFAHEGRFAAWSMVAPAGSRLFREAREEPTFSAFFGADARPGQPARSFGRKSDGDAPTAAAEPLDPAKGSPRRAAAQAAEPSIANFLIIFDVVSAGASKAESVILSLGPAFRLGENVWLLTCELTALGVRNAIGPYLLPRDSIFVVDTTRGRTSWQNFPPEIHAKLAAAWANAKQ
jgi:hypothetical protein